MTECYECARLAELMAENSALRVKVDELTCNDALAPEKIVTPVGVVANDANADSREKLEADARALQTRIWKAGANSDGISLNHIIELLDRQAAITRHECSPEAIDNMLNTIGELEEQLESAHAKNRSLKAHIAKMQEGRHGWHVKYPELEKKNAELQSKVDELTAERSEIAELVGWHGEVDENGGEPLLVPMVAAMCEGSEVAADLQKRVDELERETLSACNSCAERIDLQAKADRLARENVALARDLGECMAERDALRRENAKLSDDEFYLRCTLVDMDEEVVG